MREDHGVAMITAVMATAVVVLLTLVAIPIADHMSAASRVDRKRVFSFHAAEAGLDTAIATLATTPHAALPCDGHPTTDHPSTGTVDAGPGNGEYEVTYTYYSTFPATGSPMACPLTSRPAAVLISSTGTTTDDIYGGRRVEVLAQLNPDADAGFTKAIFSDETVDFDNSLTVEGNNGNDANIYTNGDYSCDNSQQVFGNVYAQGAIHFENSCRVNVDIWANEAITMVNSVNIGRDAKSSTSSISMLNSSAVGRNAIAGTSVTKSDNSTVSGSIIQNSVSPAPPQEDFPSIPYTASAWTGAGYTIREYTNCTTARDDLVNLAQDWTTPTVVRITTCRLVFANSNELDITNNLAIISDDGIEFNNSNKIFAVPSPTVPIPKLYLIVPGGSSCTDSVPGDIIMQNSTELKTSVHTFLYTPCTIHARNSGQMRGQMYGGRVWIRNSVSMAYRPVGAIPGYVPTEESGNVPSIIYRREVSRD